MQKVLFPFGEHTCNIPGIEGALCQENMSRVRRRYVFDASGHSCHLCAKCAILSAFNHDRSSCDYWCMETKINLPFHEEFHLSPVGLILAEPPRICREFPCQHVPRIVMVDPGNRFPSLEQVNIETRSAQDTCLFNKTCIVDCFQEARPRRST